MKNFTRIFNYCILAVLLLSSVSSLGQTPGLIVRPPGAAGPSVLNPNQDFYTSASSSGFVTNDIAESEIPYKIIPPLMTEPTGDLATGPDGGYSDIVRCADGSGAYVFNDGSNLIFRIRIGGLVSGAKAYNILLDTDLKLGATGSSADPNYIAPTNTGNGNPGFELEIALETGSRVAIYNVDGTVNGTVANAYSLATNSLVSVALTKESNNTDYFYDFYVPLTALNALGLTSTTPFRMVVTTNTNPGSAFQGSRSDIVGLDDSQVSNTTGGWEYVGSNTPPVTTENLTSGGSGFGGICTNPPILNPQITAGTNVVISGTWTRLDATRPSTATITVYVNGVAQGTTTCTSGSNWSVTVSSIAAGDTITARAQAAGESMCKTSNIVKAVTCLASNTSTNAGAAVTCATIKGIEGTKVANTRIRLYRVVVNSNPFLYADDATTTDKITYNQTTSPTGTIWEFTGPSSAGGKACNGQTSDLPEGSYYITVTETGKCESAPIFFCIASGTTTPTATPTITQTAIFPSTTTISGTAEAFSTIRLIVNGFIVASTTASGTGTYSFVAPILQEGDVVQVRAQSSSLCLSDATASLTVTCYTSAPLINTDRQGQLAAGSTTISGTSIEPAGTVISVYASPATLLGTTTVQADSTWSLTVSALTAGTGYYATAKNGTCGVSAASATATARLITTTCPLISGSYIDGATSVSGTFASAFTGTVYLYQDGAQIGSAAVSASTTWTVTLSAPNTLYSGGVLTVGAQATSGTLNTSCASTTTVGCTNPTAPSVSPTLVNITTGATVTFTLSGTESGVLYIVEDSATGTDYATSQFGNGGTQTFTTGVFTEPGTYTVNFLADNLAGSECKTLSSATIIVSAPLPVTWLSFTAKLKGQQVQLQWKTATEQNSKDFVVEHSTDGNSWNSVGVVVASGNSVMEKAYAYDHGTPLAGATNYYRIKQRDLDDRYTFSKVVSVYIGATAKAFQVYPNPVEGGKINIRVTQKETITLYNNTGNLIWQRNFQPGTQQVDVSMLPTGQYILKSSQHSESIIIR